MEEVLWGTPTCSPWLGVTMENEGIWWPPPHTWDRCSHHTTAPKSAFTGHTGGSSGTGTSLSQQLSHHGSDQCQFPNGLWCKTNPLLLLPYLCRTGEFHSRAVCLVNWNISLLFKHIPWHFPALMSASLQLSCF